MAEENGKEITIQQKSGLLATRDTKEYGIDLGEEDIIIPRLVLLQPTSQINGPAGSFYYGLNKQFYEKVTAVFFNNQRGRVMFNPDISKMESICGSDDRLVPAERFENPISTRCVDCAYSKRQYKTEVKVDGQIKYMECSETQALKGMFVDDLLPFWFVGRKTSLFPINQFLTAASFDAQKHQRPLYCFPVELTTKLIAKAGQKYYIPEIKQLGMLEKEEFTRMANKYAHAKVSDTLEEEGKKAPEGLDDTVPF